MVRCTKWGFLHITNSGNNPLKLIPTDLEFPIVPMLIIFLNIFLMSPSFFCDSFLNLGLLSEEFLSMFLHEPFNSYIYKQHLSFFM